MSTNHRSDKRGASQKPGGGRQGIVPVHSNEDEVKTNTTPISHRTADVPNVPEAKEAEMTAYDPSSWTIPEKGLSRLLYNLKLIAPGFRKRHKAHLQYLEGEANSTQREAELRIQERELREKQERREQAQLAQQKIDDVNEYAKLLVDEIRRVNQQRTSTVTVSQVRGGVTKTTTSVYVASVLAEIAHRIVTLIDNNEMWGTPGRVLGIPAEGTVTVRGISDQVDSGSVNDFRTFSGKLGSTKHGVQLVASDAMVQENNLYGYDTSKRVITIAQGNSVFVVNDTGNNIAGAAMRAALELTDVLLVPTITSGNSLAGAVITMNNYNSWGHADKVKHSIVIVSGLRPGETAEDYRSKLELSDEHILLGTPYDQRLYDDEVVDLEVTERYTQIAYLEIVLALSQIARYVQDHGYSGKPIQIKQGQLVKLPSGRIPILPYTRKGDTA